MNEEAETSDLKLRVEAPKAKTRPANAISSAPRARRRHANLPTHSCNCSCMEGIHAAILSTAIAVAQVRVEIAGIQVAMSQDLAALGDEVAGLRRHAHEHLSSAQSLVLRRFDSLQCSVIDLGLRLDRLLETDGA